MQNTNTDRLTYKGKPKDNQILVYQKGLVGFYRNTSDPTFKNKREAQRFYASDYNVDSMPYSDLFYQKGQIYRRLFPTTRKACKDLLARLYPPPSKDWIIYTIQPTPIFFSNPNCGYRLYISGFNVGSQDTFAWIINPDLYDARDRYDFSQAILAVGFYRSHKEQYRQATTIFVTNEKIRVASFIEAIQILKANL